MNEIVAVVSDVNGQTAYFIGDMGLTYGGTKADKIEYQMTSGGRYKVIFTICDERYVHYLPADRYSSIRRISVVSTEEKD